jgi:hypothetical protein
MPCQVDQLAAELHRGQVDEAAHRRGLDGVERPPEPQRGVLQDVVGLLPPAHAGVAPEHLASHPSQARAGELQEVVPHRLVVGGLLNRGTATLDGTLFVGNSAGAGGGDFFNDGSSAVTDSIITGNTADSGGGIYNAPAGTVTLRDTLVVGNKGGDTVGTVKIE